MATKMLNSSSPDLEKECQEIRDSWGPMKLSHLALSLAARSKLERHQIRGTKKGMFGEDISTLLQKLNVSKSCSESNIEPRVCEALSLWMLDPHERDAISAREALDKMILITRLLLKCLRVENGVMLCLSNKHIKQGSEGNWTKISLILSLHIHTKDTCGFGYFTKGSPCRCQPTYSQCDARRLYEAGEGGSGGIDEAIVLEILSKRSIPQLKLTFSSYKHIYRHEFKEAIEKGGFREFEDALKTVIKCMCSPSNYYAKELFTSIEGTTSDKSALSRVLMSRAEVDMDEIQRTFKKKYGKELRDLIHESIPSGDYRDFRVALATKHN